MSPRSKRVGDMDAHAIVSGLSILAWIAAIGIGVVSLALVYLLGQTYAFTAPGVSRMGPRIGRSLAPMVITYRGEELPLARLIQPARFTALIFLGALGRDAAEEHISHTLASDLRRFAALSQDTLQFIVFCTEGCERLEELWGRHDYLRVINVQDDRLVRRLAIRVVPYAVMLDTRMKVLSKGICNNFEHLCLVAAKGGRARSSKNELSRIIRICDATLTGPRATSSLDGDLARSPSLE